MTKILFLCHNERGNCRNNHEEEDEHPGMIKRFLSDLHILMFGEPAQVEAAVRAYGSKEKLKTSFEEVILNPAEEEGLDTAYLQRRFQTMAKSERLRDMTESEQESMIKRDFEALRVLKADEKNAVFLDVLHPCMTSKSPSLIQPSQSSSSTATWLPTNGIRQRKPANGKE